MLIFPSPSKGDLCDEVQLLYRTPRTSQQACGADCLYVCLRALGNQDVDLLTLEKELQIGPKGVNLGTLAATFEKHGVKATAVKLNPEHLTDLGQPMVLHVNGIHYILLLRIDGNDLVIFDNQVGLMQCTQNYFSKAYKWDGTGLMIGFPSPSSALALYGAWSSLGIGLVVALLLIPRIRSFRNPSGP